MENECECGGILKKSTTDFKDIKGIPCWKCPNCGAEFFDSKQVEILDNHISEIMNQQLDNSLNEANKNKNRKQQLRNNELDYNNIEIVNQY